MKILSVSRSTQRYYDYPLHQHGCWEIVFSLEGSGTARIGEGLYPFGPGTIFCIAPDTPHCKSADEGFIDGCILVQDLPLQLEQGLLVCQDDLNHSLQTLYQIAYNTQLRDEPNAAQVVAAIGDAIYQILLGLSARQARPNPVVEQLQRTLLENVSNCDFDLTAAIKATGYHDSYLRKLFKESLGRSPVDYFNHLRIDYAKRQLMLYHAVRSIREIAAGAGFADPYYFSRLFRKYEGMSPSQYVESLGDLNYELLTKGLTDDDPEVRAMSHRNRP